MLYENDLNDMYGELSHPVFSKYLNDENFNQNLFLKQKEIDRLITLQDLDSNNKKSEISSENILFGSNYEKIFYFLQTPLIRIIKLSNIRYRLKFLTYDSYNPENKQFINILKTSSDLVCSK